MKDLKQFIKTTIREFLNESNNTSITEMSETELNNLIKLGEFASDVFY